MSLSAGAIVGTNVRLLRPLKRGGMGSVWLAEHLTLRTQVAVKFMSERLAQDQEYVARFTREAMASAQIKSPNVVQVFDHGITPDSTPYIVMELLEGEDLRMRLSKIGTIGLDEAATIIVHVARALSKAHALGIVHRDMKPDNVFLCDQDGELFVKVLDFGIAKHATPESEGLDGMTGTGAMVGTPHYMSPEQILSARRVDHRADLWSVGVVLYRALTGQVPFQGETLGAVCIAIERGSFLPPSQRRPGLMPTLDAWFLRALARDPAQRYQSAKELADAFLSALAAGGYAPPASPFRMETTAAPRSAPTAQPPGSMTPLPGSGASSSAAAWVSGATPPPMMGTGPSAATPPPGQLAEPALPTGSGRYPSSIEPPWAASGAAAAPPPLQTFHGSSVTHAEWKSSSRRRALVTVVSGALGVVVLILIVIVVLTKGDGTEGENTAAVLPAEGTTKAAAQAAPPTPTPEPVATPAATPAATPTETVATPQAASAKASAAPVKPASTSTSTSTGKTKRDRGF
ncbi:serine/threonine-protein kinase [Polyangium mundeleinium]|uniref:Serine/threonine-protein kinase n=1 Tax=Polyangium mundeleinium TaxID=2995306 RepID=A0ABT5ES30_9BACT|nr:serine/threonine-protein kinase [Polyangium mundeleinium]MDC0743742.1 serine/threonine-protein kinase [Polyangium mundeleinium]